MRRSDCIRIRALVALGLLLSLHLAPRCDAAAARPQQPVALEASLATWAEASERCAAMGQRLAPRELAAQAAAEDAPFGPVATHRCTPHEGDGSDATIVWVDVDDSRDEAPPDLGDPGRQKGEQCQGLVFNHTSRQAYLTTAACDRRHCFLCSASQAGTRMSTAGSAQSGRRLMVANSTNCNMAGQQLQRHALLPAFECLSCTDLFSAPRFRAAAPPEWCHHFRMGRLGRQDRLPLRWHVD
jgi:hypothetical protein